jgi:hypothetical protein
MHPQNLPKADLSAVFAEFVQQIDKYTPKKRPHDVLVWHEQVEKKARDCHECGGDYDHNDSDEQVSKGS